MGQIKEIFGGEMKTRGSSNRIVHPRLKRYGLFSIIFIQLIATGYSPALAGQRAAAAKDDHGHPTSMAGLTEPAPGDQAAVIGQWGPLMSWPLVAVHMALLHTGQVLAWDAWELSSTNSARLWDPQTGAFTVVSNPYSALFCGGQTQLADGRLLGVGGHNGADIGITQTVTFDPLTLDWTQQTGLNQARWYPSALPLANDNVLALGGEITPGVDATIPEIYDPKASTWTQLITASLDVGDDYPQSYQLPDGLIFMNSGPTDNNSRTLNLETQAWSIVGPSPVADGTTAMYLPGKIIASGGGDPVMTTTAVIDMNAAAPAWTVTGPMAYPRAQHNLVVLPTGQVLAVGGAVKASLVTTDSAVLPAEMWSPASQTWATMAAMTDPRMYHSTAVLLADGSVLTAGGGRVAPAIDYLSAQVYYPPYFFQGRRPTITSVPQTTSYGAVMAVQTPDAAQIASVALVRPGSVTHTFDPDQRFIPLSFDSRAGILSVHSPANGDMAPPGYYMLFISNYDGVPSVARFIQISSLPQKSLYYLPLVQ
jgi:hypothetical protein